MTKAVTGYPFIGGENSERGGMTDYPAVDSALISAPTETWTRFAAALSSATLGAAALVSGGLGYELHKRAGTVYRKPIFVNS